MNDSDDFEIINKKSDIELMRLYIENSSSSEISKTAREILEYRKYRAIVFQNKLIVLLTAIMTLATIIMTLSTIIQVILAVVSVVYGYG